jgi:hypothetical protein
MGYGKGCFNPTAFSPSYAITEQVDSSAHILTNIWDVLGSNLGPDTGFLDRRFVVFLRSVQSNVRILSELYTTASFPILPDEVFTNHHTVRRFIISDTGPINIRPTELFRQTVGARACVYHKWASLSRPQLE